MKILITGGGGFLGRHVTELLAKEGHTLTITATGSEPPLPVAKTMYMSFEGIDWKHVKGQDAVIHLMANNDTRCLDREEVNRANIFGPTKLLSEAYQGGCRRFVIASSAAIYGKSPVPFTELTPENPLTPYAESKQAFDHLAWVFATQDYTDVSVASLRFCNIYGPGEGHKGRRMSMVGQLLRRAIANKKLQLFKDGEQRRDWLYVNDAAESVRLALHANLPGFEKYNIGSGKSWTFNEIISYITQACRKLDIQPEKEYIDCPFPDEYQTHTECDIKKASEKLAFVPRYDLRTGVHVYFTSLLSELSLQPTRSA